MAKQPMCGWKDCDKPGTNLVVSREDGQKYVCHEHSVSLLEALCDLLASVPEDEENSDVQSSGETAVTPPNRCLHCEMARAIREWQEDFVAAVERTRDRIEDWEIKEVSSAAKALLVLLEEHREAFVGSEYIDSGAGPWPW